MAWGAEVVWRCTLTGMRVIIIIIIIIIIINHRKNLAASIFPQRVPYSRLSIASESALPDLSNELRFSQFRGRNQNRVF